MVQSNLLLKYKNIQHYFFDRYDSSHIEDFKINTDLCVGVEQIHSNKVIIVPHKFNKEYKNSDGMITRESCFLKIKTADCLPIFFYDEEKKIVAAVHAGWKGLLSGIIKNTVNKMEELGCRSKNMITAIGPHIKVCCYKVSYDRISLFKKYSTELSGISEYRSSQWFLDLDKIALLQMVNLGISRHNIDILPFCTSCDDRFFSYRREGSVAKRMFSVIRVSD